MQKLIAELIQLGKVDTGTPEQQREMTVRFVEALQLYLTPKAIDTFPVSEVRQLYTRWVQIAIAKISYQEANDELVRFIRIFGIPRELPELPAASNIVSLFSNRA